MTAVAKAKTGLTSEAFLLWTESETADARHELLDGAVYAMAAERAVHARTKANVFRQFEREIAGRNLPCEAFPDGMAVRVDDTNVFEPDALVRCGDRLPDDALLVTDPMVVVEVASPSTQRVDALTKFARYFRNPHIVHYLIVVPASAIVIHHLRVAADRIESLSHESGTLVLEPPGVALSVEELFSVMAGNGA